MMIVSPYSFRNFMFILGMLVSIFSVEMRGAESSQNQNQDQETMGDEDESPPMRAGKEEEDEKPFKLSSLPAAPGDSPYKSYYERSRSLSSQRSNYYSVQSSLQRLEDSESHRDAARQLAANMVAMASTQLFEHIGDSSDIFDDEINQFLSFISSHSASVFAQMVAEGHLPSLKAARGLGILRTRDAVKQVIPTSAFKEVLKSLDLGPIVRTWVMKKVIGECLLTPTFGTVVEKSQAFDGCYLNVVRHTKEKMQEKDQAYNEEQNRFAVQIEESLDQLEDEASQWSELQWVLAKAAEEQAEKQGKIADEQDKGRNILSRMMWDSPARKTQKTCLGMACKANESLKQQEELLAPGVKQWLEAYKNRDQNFSHRSFVENTLKVLSKIPTKHGTLGDLSGKKIYDTPIWDLDNNDMRTMLLKMSAYLGWGYLKVCGLGDVQARAKRCWDQSQSFADSMPERSLQVMNIVKGSKHDSGMEAGIQSRLDSLIELGESLQKEAHDFQENSYDLISTSRSFAFKASAPANFVTKAVQAKLMVFAMSYLFVSLQAMVLSPDYVLEPTSMQQWMVGAAFAMYWMTLDWANYQWTPKHRYF